MLESDRVIDIIAAFLRDKDEFKVVIRNDSYKTPYYYCNNLISGNNYSIYFENNYGEKTEYFEKIIKGIIEGKIKISDDEKEMINLINNVLKNNKESELHFSVSFNTTYQPHMKKEGRINKIEITTKENGKYYKKMDKSLIICGIIGIVAILFVAVAFIKRKEIKEFLESDACKDLIKKACK